MIVISLENYFERFLVSTIPLVHVGADCAKENERETKEQKQTERKRKRKRNMNGDEWLPGVGGTNKNGKVFQLFARNLQWKSTQLVMFHKLT